MSARVRQANALFAGLQSAFQQQLSAAWALATAAPRPPVAAFVSFTAAYPPGVPDPTFSISTAAYKQHYLLGAGASPLRPPASNPSGSFPTAAALRQALAGVDVVIDETFAADPRNYTWLTFLDTFGFTDDDVASGARPPARGAPLSLKRAARWTRRKPPAAWDVA